MGHGIVKCIVYAVTMGILYIVMESMNNRNSGGKGASHNDSHYIVRVPSALKYVYMIMFFMGILLFFVFLLFKIKGNVTVTMGHLWFALIFAGIGLLIMIWATRWSIQVNESEIEVYRMFHKKTELSISNIGNVEIGKKEEIVIFDEKGKKIITVGGLSENYDYFIKSLRAYGKLK